MTERPDDVAQNGGDLFWYREADPSPGESGRVARRVCEACWQTIPLYVDHPGGLVSPDSDLELPTRKTRPQMIDGVLATAVFPKAVCVACYLAAFARVYPDWPVPTVSTDLRSDV